MKQKEVQPGDNQVNFVFCGEIRAEKGIQELFQGFRKAVDQLRSSETLITLDLYGQINPEYLEEFNRLQMEFKDEKIKYHGYLTHQELMNRLPGYDVLVLPTYLPTEGYPGVIIEGMSFGLPVITTRWRALPEIVKDGRNGLLVETHNPEDLAEKLVNITQDSQQRSFLGNNARDEAQKYDVDIVLPDLCDLIGLSNSLK
jgi:glycosyltransferase involved in cell wall biosynthesis